MHDMLDYTRRIPSIAAERFILPFSHDEVGYGKGPMIRKTPGDDGHLFEQAPHAGLLLWVRDLNRFYRGAPSMHELDDDSSGFEWIDCNDHTLSVGSVLRLCSAPDELMLFVRNFTPVPQQKYRTGAPLGGFWRERLNSDATLYGGSGQGNIGGVKAGPPPRFDRRCSLTITLPPLAIVAFRAESGGGT